MPAVLSSEKIPEPCVCAFLCAYSYDKNRVRPSKFKHKCKYHWKWPAVYSHLSDWKRFSCSESDAQCMFAYRESDETVFVIFRGTESWKDVLTDASVYKNPLPFMEDTAPSAKVHRGFFTHYRAVLDAVKEYITRHTDRKRVVITGHSLGAAIAVLCASRIKDDFDDDNVRCVVFGCPRVGNSAFVRRAEEIIDIERFVVGNDPVSDIPTRLRWKHVGRVIRYVDGKRVKVPDNDSLLNALRFPNLFCVSDHLISEYIDCIASDPTMMLDNSAPEPTLSWWQAGLSDSFFCLAWIACIMLYIADPLTSFFAV